ncbi:hypothetical protein RDWZM_006680 [Blomia tropicalis]|uniref:Lariat debranching enzyme C-terminal domain-containing protein n=1 Tax=Blomia tropicalis TaxID=40697 RepID=A0A9Q0RLZ3_BLOTA|nr:hypothetical protein RDWZM_006680 [Blomia tropicalis]
MKIAVVGCLHGELDIIYEKISQLEQEQNITVDILFICGDFQAIRNVNDLKCMSVPDKYKRLGTFHSYYFGDKVASKLTILIGGNHEASNYLQTLPYGGWVAPKMYYMGYGSVVRYGGLRIGGISGIFNYHNAKRGHYEGLPYDQSTMRSAYHMRETEIYKFLQLSSNSWTNPKRPLDIFLSHDWPLNIHSCGNVRYLLQRKQHFREDVQNDRLGNPLLQPLVTHLRPQRWFSAHLHVLFRATVRHQPSDQDSNEDELITEFQALDKVLPNRGFLELFDVEPEIKDLETENSNMTLSYDPEWLAILKKLDHLMKVDHKPINEFDIFNGRNQIEISDEDLKEINSIMENNLNIPENFSCIDPVPKPDQDLDPNRQHNYLNPQTTRLCQLLSIQDPNVVFIETEGDQSQTEQPMVTVKNPDAIDLSDDDDGCCQEESTKKTKLDNEPNCHFFIDKKGNKI